MKAIVAIICIWAIAFTAVFFYVVGFDVSRQLNDAELIKRGLKQYNTTTGVIEWVEK